MNNKLTLCFLLGILPLQMLYAATLSSVSLTYDELEKDAGMQQMRYLINDKFLRVDNGKAASDFILFNVNNKNIYSVNHDDKTILKISHQAWKVPTFEFSVSRRHELMQAAPEINNKPVFNYQVKAGDKVCTDVFLIKNMFMNELKIIRDYQQTLSSQQVLTLKNTPKEFHNPCFLLDQVYHLGDYYLLGLPVQITYSRGYAKYLKHYEKINVDETLFVLPEGYEEYLPFTE